MSSPVPWWPSRRVRVRSAEYQDEPPVQVVQLARDLRDVAAAKTPAERRNALYELARLDEGGSAQLDPLDWAERVESTIRSAVDALDDPYRKAADILLFSPSRMNLTERRGRAAEVIGVAIDTFRRRYEGDVLREVALRLEQLWLATSRSGELQADWRSARSELPRSAQYSDVSVARHLLSEADEGVVLLGSVLLVKRRNKVVGKTLSSDQLRDLRRNRTHVLADPDAALRFVIEADPST